MSAFLLHEQTIGLIAHFAHQSKAAQYAECYQSGLTSAKQIARLLAKANLRSLTVRYQDSTTDGDFVFITACERESAREWDAPVMELLKSLDCFQYQACEPDDWYTTLAFKVISATRTEAVRKLPGYAAAQWGYKPAVLPPIVRNKDLQPGEKPAAGQVIRLGA